MIIKSVKSLIFVVAFYILFRMGASVLDGFDFSVYSSYIKGASLAVIILCIGVAAYFSHIYWKNNKKIVWICSLIVFSVICCYSPDVSAASAPACDTRAEGCPKCTPSADSLDCWPCILFEGIFDAVDSVAVKLYEKLANPLLKLMTIGFALWLIFQTLLQLINFRDQQVSRYLTSMGVMAVKVAVAAGVISMGTTLFSFIVGPLIDIAVDFARAAHDSYQCTQVVSVSSSFLSGSIKPKLFCMIYTMFNEVQTGLNVGTAIMCVAQTSPTMAVKDIKVGGMNFEMLAFGAMFWVSHAIVMILFPLYVLDAVFRFCFFLVMVPFMVVMWPFGFLKGVTKRMFSILLRALVTLVLLSITLKITSGMFSALAGTIDPLLVICSDNKNLTQGLSGISSTTTGIILSPFYVLAFGLISWMLLCSIPGIAGVLVGGGDMGGKRLGNDVAQAAAMSMVSLGMKDATNPVSTSGMKNVTSIITEGTDKLSNWGKEKAKNSEGFLGKGLGYGAAALGYAASAPAKAANKFATGIDDRAIDSYRKKWKIKPNEKKKAAGLKKANEKRYADARKDTTKDEN